MGLLLIQPGIRSVLDYPVDHSTGAGKVWRLAIISLVGVGLSSCSSLPKGGTGPIIAPARIVEAVRCELARAFAPGNPDPAGIIGWKVLTTITIDDAIGYEVHPGIAGMSGKSGKATWKAPTGGIGYVGSTTRHAETEYKVRDIRSAIERAPCPDPDAPTAARGLPIATWLRNFAGGQPAPETGAAPVKTSLHRVYTASASAGGGLTFAFADFSLSFEGNKASLSNTYTIDVRRGPQTGPSAPFMSAGLAEAFGFNELGELDDFSDLRRDRDKDEEDETVIKVAPGQSIIIQ